MPLAIPKSAETQPPPGWQHCLERSSLSVKTININAYVNEGMS